MLWRKAGGVFREKRRRAPQGGIGDCELLGRRPFRAHLARRVRVEPFNVKVGADDSEEAQRERDVGGGLARRERARHVHGNLDFIRAQSGAVGYVVGVVPPALLCSCRIDGVKASVGCEQGGGLLQARTAGISEGHAEKRGEDCVVAVVHRLAFLHRELRLLRGV